MNTSERYEMSLKSICAQIESERQKRIHLIEVCRSLVGDLEQIKSQINEMIEKDKGESWKI